MPFSAALGLFHVSTLWLTLILLPAVLLGTWLGRILIRRLSQLRFERPPLAATAIAPASPPPPQRPRMYAVEGKGESPGGGRAYTRKGNTNDKDP